MDQQKKLDNLDPLSIAESLGIKTFRKVSRNAWSPEDDIQLVTYLKEVTNLPLSQINADDVDWDLLASKLAMDGNRKAKDFKKRWITSLDPNVKKGKWTKEEDDQLIDAYKRFGPSWQRVASFIRTRTMDQCAKRYTEVLDPKTKDRLNPWTREEEMLLIKQIGIHGTKWRTVASHFKNRPALTCRNKWRTIALSVARGRATPYVTAEVEKITNKNGVLNANSPTSNSSANSPVQNMSPQTSSNQPSNQTQMQMPASSSSTEWKYSLGVTENTPNGQLPHSQFLSDDSGFIKDETSVNQLLAYAKNYNLAIEVHQHVHHHYGPPPHPFNHIQPNSPIDFGVGVNNLGFGMTPTGQPSNKSFFLEPESQLNRFQHFNYLPPLTEVPKLTSSNSHVITPTNGKSRSKHNNENKREESPASLTPLTQAVEMAAEELTKKRKEQDTNELRKKQRLESDDEEDDGLDFWEQMRNVGELSNNQPVVQQVQQNQRNNSESFYSKKPVSQHHPLHNFTGSVTPQPASSSNTPAPKLKDDEDDDMDYDEKSYGLFYQSYSKSRSASVANTQTNLNGKPHDQKKDNKSAASSTTDEAEAPNYVYENLLGSFGMMPFNPS